MHKLGIIADEKITKIQQIVLSIKRDIDKGILKKDAKLPSINDFSVLYGVARDTIEKAYKELKKLNYIVSVASKGYFVIGKQEKKIKILLVFNKLSSYKKIIYDSFLHTLGNKAKVDLQIHHYDPRLLKDIVASNLGKYHYYVIMPHFFLNANLNECQQILEMIPENELVILDKQLPGWNKNCIEVYQDFKYDIYNALASASSLLNKYKTLNLLLDKCNNHPQEIITGVVKYSNEFNKALIISPNADEIQLKIGTVYIVTTESDLPILIKKIRKLEMKLGKEVGIISFNETPLKELLDISVISTDFKAMGRTVAKCILNNKIKKVINPFYMIKRGSL